MSKKILIPIENETIFCDCCDSRIKLDNIDFNFSRSSLDNRIAKIYYYCGSCGKLKDIETNYEIIES